MMIGVLEARGGSGVQAPARAAARAPAFTLPDVGGAEPRATSAATDDPAEAARRRAQESAREQEPPRDQRSEPEGSGGRSSADAGTIGAVLASGPLTAGDLASLLLAHDPARLRAKGVSPVGGAAGGAGEGAETAAIERRAEAGREASNSASLAGPGEHGGAQAFAGERGADAAARAVYKDASAGERAERAPGPRAPTEPGAGGEIRRSARPPTPDGSAATAGHAARAEALVAASVARAERPGGESARPEGVRVDAARAPGGSGEHAGARAAAAQAPAADRGGRAERPSHEVLSAFRRGAQAEALHEPAPAQAVRALSAAMETGGGPVTLRLTPAHLGQLRVRVEMGEVGVRARFEVTSGEAQRAIEGGIDSLRGALEARGLSVESLHVEVTPTPPGGGPGADARADAPATGEASDEPPPGEAQGPARDGTNHLMKNQHRGEGDGGLHGRGSSGGHAASGASLAQEAEQTAQRVLAAMSRTVYRATMMADELVLRVDAVA